MIDQLTDQEKWKAVPGYEGLYSISNQGKVKKRERVIAQRGGWDGYKCVTLRRDGWGKTHYVHRLIGQAFIDNPNNLPQINHIDGNPFNNRRHNLEWCDPSHNTQHGFDIGLSPKGEEHGRSKLSDKDVKRIRELYQTGEYSKRKLGILFRVSDTWIRQLLKGKYRSEAGLVVEEERG